MKNRIRNCNCFLRQVLQGGFNAMAYAVMRVMCYDFADRIHPIF